MVLVHEIWERQAKEAAEAAAAPLWSLSNAEVGACLLTVHRWENNVAALKARLVAESSSRAVPAEQGRRSVRTWLRAALPVDPRFFALSRPVAGAVRVTGLLDVESAAIVEAALQPLCRPTPGDDRAPRQQSADALVDICQLAMRTSELPAHDGEPAQIAVTVAFDPLIQTLRGASLDNGQRLSAAGARRLACDARVLPLVLGGDSQVLDAGRTRRLAHGPLRRALAVRDKGCAHPDCDRPPRWCDAHHLRSWLDGGPTCVDNLVLLCRHHHRLLHEPGYGWQVRLATDRLPEFIPPPWIDPTGLPRRNLYHLRT